MTERDPFDDAVRRALAREAEQVRPDPDGLYRIRERIGTESRSRRPWLITVAGAGVAAAAAVGLFAMLDRNTTDQTTSDPGVASAPSTVAQTPALETPGPATPTPQPSAKQSTRPTTVRGLRAVPVYWLGNTIGRKDAGLRLYRTFVRVKGDDPVLGAVSEMAAGRPADPDYLTPWTGARPLSVTRAGGTITVDFGSLPVKNIGARDSIAAVQQLVYTVQGTLHAGDPVRVTLKGGPAGPLFGQVDSSAPFARAAAVDVQAFVWITTPDEAATVAAPVTIGGTASTFEATVNWRIRSLGTGKVVQQGHTTATAGSGEFGTFRFAVALPPGKYTVECLELSADNGQDTNTDTKTIVVR